jgi:hypothetical protein
MARLSRQNMVVTTSVLCPEHECQRSVNDFWPCITENAKAVLPYKTILKQSATFLHENGCDNIATMYWTWASTECHYLLALHLGKYKSCAASWTYNQTIGRIFKRKCLPQHHHYAHNNEPQQSVNNLWPCVLENQKAMRLHWPITKLLAGFLGKVAYDKIVTMSHN